MKVHFLMLFPLSRPLESKEKGRPVFFSHPERKERKGHRAGSSTGNGEGKGEGGWGCGADRAWGGAHRGGTPGGWAYSAALGTISRLTLSVYW